MNYSRARFHRIPSWHSCHPSLCPPCPPCPLCQVMFSPSKVIHSVSERLPVTGPVVMAINGCVTHSVFFLSLSLSTSHQRSCSHSASPVLPSHIWLHRHVGSLGYQCRVCVCVLLTLKQYFHTFVQCMKLQSDRRYLSASNQLRHFIVYIPSLATILISCVIMGVCACVSACACACVCVRV